jgi:hypothetical protein
MTGRTVTLVLVDRAGDVLGCLAPFDVPTPWWQHLLPIHDRVPGLAILRLLTAERAPDHPMGGRVTYLAEPMGAPPSRLQPWQGRLEDDPLRMPWARPGGPAADLRWAASIVEPTGLPVQHRSWNLSAIWSIPVSDTTVWLKCVPPFFAHEAAVLKLLADQPMPRLLAADGHRLLLAELPGLDGYDATPNQHRVAVDTLVSLQAATARRVDDLLSAGVPDNRWPHFIENAKAIVRRRAPSDLALRDLVSTIDQRVARISACGLDDVLSHGDAHTGNVRIGVDPPIWFDWGDSGIGHPMFDLAALSGHPAPSAGELLGHWLDAWAGAVPGSDPHRAWSLVKPLAALRCAMVLQRFLDLIEPSERPYHQWDVQPFLDSASRIACAKL